MARTGKAKHVGSLKNVHLSVWFSDQCQTDQVDGLPRLRPSSQKRRSSLALQTLFGQWQSDPSLHRNQLHLQTAVSREAIPRPPKTLDRAELERSSPFKAAQPNRTNRVKSLRNSKNSTRTGILRRTNQATKRFEEGGTRNKKLETSKPKISTAATRRNQGWGQPPEESENQGSTKCVSSAVASSLDSWGLLRAAPPKQETYLKPVQARKSQPTPLEELKAGAGGSAPEEKGSVGHLSQEISSERTSS